MMVNIRIPDLKDNYFQHKMLTYVFGYYTLDHLGANW